MTTLENLKGAVFQLIYDCKRIKRDMKWSYWDELDHVAEALDAIEAEKLANPFDGTIEGDFMKLCEGIKQEKPAEDAIQIVRNIRMNGLEAGTRYLQQYAEAYHAKKIKEDASFVDETGNTFYAMTAKEFYSWYKTNFVPLKTRNEMKEVEESGQFKVGDVVTLIDSLKRDIPAYANNTESVIICKFPESDRYLLNKHLYGYEYWEGRLLQLIPPF